MKQSLPTTNKTFTHNVAFMRSKATRYAFYGVGIAVLAIIIATFSHTYLSDGHISIYGAYEAQKSNAVLWVLDTLPFIFAFWGQYASSVIAYEASAMITEQTEELRQQSADLELRVMHDSTHDPLTGLPNRSLLLDRIHQMIGLASREKSILALLVLDLNHFKEVNDTLGHYQGDILLKQVALRLENVLRPSDTIARLGGDEFAILLSNLRANKNIKLIIAKINKVFATPYTLQEDLPLSITTSIGVAFFPDHGRDGDTLLQRADIAMYVAKQSQRDHLIYSGKIDQHSSQRLTMMAELSNAIDNNDLVVYYQPKVCRKTMQILGVEALVRWQHETHGLIPPDDFIPMAERTGLITALTNWVLQSTCRTLKDWSDQGIQLKASVNLAVQTLLDPEFPETLTGMLAAVDLPRDSLMLEITETSVIKDPELALKILFRLRNLGIEISIDDFGTGYSSLAYLGEMPVSEVKIDKSFVLGMLDNKKDGVIVKSIIDLAHNLGLQVVAEGVETKAIAGKLNTLGCDLLQGYLFSKPIPASDFKQWLSRHNKRLQR